MRRGSGSSHDRGPVQRRRRNSHSRGPDRNPTEAIMAGLLFIVSPRKPGTYTYMKLVTESEDVVVLDRRKTDRRQNYQWAMPERRHRERRRRDVMTDIEKSGWAVVRR